MARPGTDISIRTVAPPRSAPTDTGVWFVAGTSDSGPTTPVRIQSMTDFTLIFGQRASYSVLHDALDTFFNEGGAVAYVSRVVGPSPTTGQLNLLDSGAGTSLTVLARGPGAYSANIKVGVVAGVGAGTFQLRVLFNNVLVEQSGDLVTQADAVNWGLNSNYVRIVLGASALVPATVADTVLSTGTDDRANANDTTWKNAITLFTKDLGPGQVSYPGRTTDQAHLDLLAHAAANNRFAIIDAPDTPTAATLSTSAVNSRNNGRNGAMYAPWLVVPGVVGGVNRTVPPSAAVSGAIARSDRLYSPNKPAAGQNGTLQFAIGLTQPDYGDANRTTLNNNGVNVIRQIFGGIEIYGWRALADPVADPSWVDAGNGRLAMAISAQAQNVLEDFVFDEIDGAGLLQAQLKSSLNGVLLPFFNEGSLYGATPDAAFYVDTGSQVNTPTTLANNELHAVIALRMSPMAEWVKLEIAKVPITQEV